MLLDLLDAIIGCWSALWRCQYEEFDTLNDFDGIYLLENIETKRYLLQDGEPIGGNCGNEWTHSGFKSPKVVGSDANYNNRALWKITPQGNGNYLIENVETKRLLSQDGQPIRGKRGAEGGWLAHSGFRSPNTVGADTNYHNRAYWRILPQGGGKCFIENVETKRYLFQDGKKFRGTRGEERGWQAQTGFKSPNVVGADANYYNRAYYRLIRQR